MYKAYFKLDSNPFSSSPPPNFIFQSKELKEALAHFSFALENREAFLLLTGEVGTGKTTAVQSVLRLLPKGTPVALVTHTTLEPRELLEIIALKFGLTGLEGKSKPLLLRELEHHFEAQWAEGRQSLLILDEAHLLKPAVLEEVRLLSNLEREGGKLVQICLVGQPELIARLQRSELRQLRQRISVRYALRPLSETETRDYVAHRLRAAGSPAPEQVFTPDALAAIHASTHGIPREINVIASQSLLNAYLAESPRVGVEHVSTVGKDYGFEGLRQIQTPSGEREITPPPVTKLRKPGPPGAPPPGMTPKPIPLPPEHLRPAPRRPPGPSVRERPRGEPVALGSPAQTEPGGPKGRGSGWIPWALLVLAGLFFLWRYWLGTQEGEVLLQSETPPREQHAEVQTFEEDGTQSGMPVLPADSTKERLFGGGAESRSAVFRDTLEVDAQGAFEEAVPATVAAADTGASADTASSREDSVQTPENASPRRFLITRRIREGLYRGPVTTQVASFRVKDVADRVLDEITARVGLRGLVELAACGGEPCYRILVGRFNGVEAAKDALRPLIESRLVTEVMIIPLPLGLAPRLGGANR